MAVAFIRAIFSVYIDVYLIYTLINPRSKPGVERVHINVEYTREYLFLRPHFCIFMNKLQQRFKAEALGYIVHYEVGLEVSKTQVRITVGTREPGVQIAYWQQAILLNRPNQFQPLAAAPFRASLAFFPGRNPLRQ